MRAWLAVTLCLLFSVSNAMADEIRTKYLTIDLPDNWKVVMPPAENQTTSTVIVATVSGNSTVGFIAGPGSGADAKTVAEIFAKQFKASRPPVEKNGQYTFTFLQQQTLCQAWVAAESDIFLVTTLQGDRKVGLAFAKKHVTSEDYATLLPK